MVMAAAEVNPEMTGTEMKSIRQPSLRRPHTRMIRPDRKERRTA